MSSETLTIEEVLTEVGLVPKWIAQGMEKGREEGREEHAIKIARNLLKKGWSVEDAAEVAELAVEKARALAE